MTSQVRTVGLAVFVSLIFVVAGCGGTNAANASMRPGGSLASGSLGTTSKLPGLDAACGVGKPRIRPSTINFCGDGGFVITRMKWPKWTAMSAAGRGTGHLNDCTPNCAEGHFHSFAVSVRISRPTGCRHGTRAFTRLSVVRLAGRKPPNGTWHYGFGCP
jgi:hypothetical protein